MTRASAASGNGEAGLVRAGPAIAVAVTCPRWSRTVPGLRRRVRAAALATLADQGGAGRQELAVLLADDAALRALNHRFRGLDKPTNVLSFPAGEVGHLGDIAIAFETARREAEEQEKPLADHLAHLVVHGVLHLLGRDHERPDEAEAMEQAERRVLAGLGIADPYEGSELVA